MTYSSPFGPTKCGLILNDHTKDNPRLARKVRAFYDESMKTLHALTRIKSNHARQILREAYLAHRDRQFAQDVDLGDMDSSQAADIDQRMGYVLRQGSRFLL